MKTLTKLTLLTLLSLTISIACKLITSCEFKEETIQDRCLQRVIFKECMNSLPAGPVSTHYNDWDDVVGACEKVAWHKSWRKRSVIKIECQGS